MKEFDTATRKKEIGKRIKERRLELGLSRTQLGRLIGYTNERCDTNVESFEKGRTYCPPERLRLLREALDLTWDEIIP